jgi:NAD(P)-dependent dehydrogenase (short-subunit alcohol dehydrogenase family)
MGRATAQALHERGCKVTIASRAPNLSARSETPPNITYAACDVRQSSEVTATLQNLVDVFGCVDIVVNFAGISRAQSVRQWADPLVNLTDEEWQEVTDTNVRGMFLIARAAAQHMIPRRRGQIVNISSARGARRGQPFASGYCATKMAALVMFQALTAELASWGVRAWSLLPDAVATGLIADTNLAKRGAIPAVQMGSLIADMLSLPEDVVFEDPLLAPFCAMPTSGIEGGELCRR